MSYGYENVAVPELEMPVNIEVQCLGKVLEGEGSITSTLPEDAYSQFGEALTQSVSLIEEADCPSCIDGRRCLCQADGSKPLLRSRKAGGGVSTLAMVGMGDRMVINYLVDNSESSNDIYEFSGSLQQNLGNKESGHFDCGAAKGLAKHSRTVSNLDIDSPAVKLVTDIMTAEAPGQNAVQLSTEVIEQAGPFATILEKCGWDGEEYVDEVAKKEPGAVEKLEVDENDRVGGHREDAVVVVDGPVDSDGRPKHTINEEVLFGLTGRRAFVVNLNELRRDAVHLGVSEKHSARLLTAGLLHHVGGVYKNLGDGSHPLFLVKVQA